MYEPPTVDPARRPTGGVQSQYFRRYSRDARSRAVALNDAYQALLDYYGPRSTQINRGQSHENGVAWRRIVNPPKLHNLRPGLRNIPLRLGKEWPPQFLTTLSTIHVSTW